MDQQTALRFFLTDIEIAADGTGEEMDDGGSLSGRSHDTTRQSSAGSDYAMAGRAEEATDFAGSALFEHGFAPALRMVCVEA